MTEVVFGLIFIWLVVSLLFFIAYDIYAINKGIKTISLVIFEISTKYPIIPALMGMIVGILMGHFFFPIVITAGQ